MKHKAGFVNIIGLPNVGKSTLMNALVGEKLSIITSKAQTTRHRIMGIVNGEDFQIVYSDTPGLVREPSYKMHMMMNQYIETALKDADIVLLMTEPGNPFDQEAVIDKLRHMPVPKIILINKIDLSDQASILALIQSWQERFPQAPVIPISASNNFNLENVLEAIVKLLPEHEAYYAKDELTDRSMRFFVSEIIREKILLLFQKEIPYSTEIAVENYLEEERMDRISATIYVERESQKAIIIGHQGQAIKKLGTQARIDIEAFTGRKAFLELSVKVNPNWRDDENALTRFGYDH